jgi:hypothetical protein
VPWLQMRHARKLQAAAHRRNGTAGFNASDHLGPAISESPMGSNSRAHEKVGVGLPLHQGVSELEHAPCALVGVPRRNSSPRQLVKERGRWVGAEPSMRNELCV